MGRRKETQPHSIHRSGRDAAFEAAVGARIRNARVAAGMTQRALGDAVGIAYQKLQKYELGQDRIAISTLHQIAKALNRHPGSFFDEHTRTPFGSASGTRTAQRSAALFQEVSDPRVAKTLLALVKELGKGGDDAEEEPEIALPGTPAMNATPAMKGKSRRARLQPTRAVVDPLLALLKQSDTGDAGALALLLGQALAEAAKIVRGTA